MTFRSVADASLGAIQKGFGGADLRSVAGYDRTQFDMAAHEFRQFAAGVMSQAMVDAAVEKVAYCISQCDRLESPIERAVLPWLMFQDYGPFQTIPARLHVSAFEMLPPKGDVIIAPQFQFARFRFDFAVVASLGSNTKIVAVECDGAGFHNRNVDATRDEYLRRLGVDTVRATGSEIHENPRSVARKVARILTEWAVAK